MNCRGGARNQQRGGHEEDQREEKHDIDAKTAAVTCRLLTPPDAMGEQSHTASVGACARKSPYPHLTVASYNLRLTD